MWKVPGFPSPGERCPIFIRMPMPPRSTWPPETFSVETVLSAVTFHVAPSFTETFVAAPVPDMDALPVHLPPFLSVTLAVPPWLSRSPVKDDAPETETSAEPPVRETLPFRAAFVPEISAEKAPPSSTLTLFGTVSTAFRPEARIVTLLVSPSAKRSPFWAVISPLKNVLSPEKSAVTLLPSSAVIFPFIPAPAPEKTRFMMPVFVPGVP